MTDDSDRPHKSENESFTTERRRSQRKLIDLLRFLGILVVNQIFISQQKHHQLKIFDAAFARLKNLEIPDDLLPLPKGDRPDKLVAVLLPFD